MKRISFQFFVLLFLLLAAGFAVRTAWAQPPKLPLENHIYLPVLFLRPGIQAPVLKWEQGGCFSSWCQTGWYASPAVANIDSDPQLEVLAGTYDLVALDGESGALQWRAENNSRVWPGIVIVDLTGDGSLEIIAGRDSDQLSVYDAAGNLLWQRNPFGDGEIRTLAAADLELDGDYEIIVGRASGGSTKQLSVFEADGSVRTGWPARRDNEPGYGWGMYNQNAAVADLDGNGFKEIVGPTDTHYITALHHNGDQIQANSIFEQTNPQGLKVWSQVGVHVDHAVDLRGYAYCGTEHRPNFADSAPVIADLDGDTFLEIVVVGNVYNCGTNPYTSLYQMPFIFHDDRSRWAGSGYNWTSIPTPDSSAAPLRENYAVIETVVPNPAIADLDGDGVKEILFASYDGRVHAYWLDKREHHHWPFQVSQPGEGVVRFASEPVIADLDADGQAEVIFSSWVEKGSGLTGKVHVLNSKGEALHEIALPAAKNGDWNGAMAAPTLVNLDLDPDLELVIQTAHSGVVVYDLPNTARAVTLWETGRGNYLRSGSVE